MKKVLLISNMYPSDQHPSYGVFVKNFEIQLNNSQDFRIQQKAIIKGRSNTFFVKILQYAQFYLKIARGVLFFNNDIIYIHQVSHCSPIIWILMPFLKTKLVANFHGDDAFINNSFERILFPFTKSVANNAALIIVPSGFLKEEVAKRFKIDVNKIHISPSGGINTTIFKPHNQTHAYNKLLHVGYFGRFDQRKGINCLFNAMPNLKNIGRFTFIGTGALLESFQCNLRNLDLPYEIEFFATKTQRELVDHFNQLDLFIYPTERESLGLIGLEAMACGIPVIGSSIPGTADYLIDKYNSLVFTVNNANELASCVQEFYNTSDELKEQMSSNARLTALKYSSDSVSRDLLQRLMSLF
jgi:L-malate glycosyltransferase